MDPINIEQPLTDADKSRSSNGPCYAGFWVRFWAMMIDAICLGPIVYCYQWLVLNYNFGHLVPVLNTFMLWFLPAVIIVAFWRFKGASPGKMLMSIRIVDAATLQPATTRRLILRYAAYSISFFAMCLGYLWVAIDKKSQGWHDKIARTVVIFSEGPQVRRRRVFRGLAAAGAVSAVLIGAAAYWLVTHLKELKSGGEVIRREAGELGSQHNSVLCLDEALKRNARKYSFMNNIDSQVFLSRCLEASGNRAGLCDNVPSALSFRESFSWFIGTCQQLAPENPNCGKLLSEVSNFCNEQKK